MLGRILPNPWDRLVAGLSVVAVGAAASVVSGSGASRGDATLVVLAALMVSVLWPRREHLAWFAGAMLPVQAIDGASSDMIEVLRVAVVLLAVLRYPADLTGPGTKIVARLVTLLVALTAVQLVFGVARDPFLPTVRMIALSAVTISVAWVVVNRTGVHRPLLMGYLAGATVSATVVLSQAAGNDLLRTAAHGPDRYPGLALQAPGLAWHMVAAIFIALFALAPGRSFRMRALAAGALALCTLALVVCGAQGGLLGLAVGVGVCAVHAWTRLDRPGLVRWLAIGLVAFGATFALSSLVGFGTSSVDGVMGDPDKGYANERARLDALSYGIEQLVESPLTGLGPDEYDSRYDVRPHVIPLNAAVNTGLLGFAVGMALLLHLLWVVVKGPVDGSHRAGWLGTAILGAMLTLAFLTPTGPFARIERLSVLLIAVVLCRGGGQYMHPPDRSDAESLESAPKGLTHL